MYAIIGITGKVGGAIAENLLAQGEKIRAIVRSPEKAARWRDRGARIPSGEPLHGKSAGLPNGAGFHREADW